MSGYRRFIAYVYEYLQGKKSGGKGFIRVEAKNGVCRIRYKLAGIYGKGEVHGAVFGYVREGGKCRGILLGYCDLAGNSVEFEQELEEGNLNGSGRSLNDLCGLILLTETGEVYGSGWDDKPLNINEIQLPEEKREENTQRQEEDEYETESGEFGQESTEEETESPDRLREKRGPEEGEEDSEETMEEGTEREMGTESEREREPEYNSEGTELQKPEESVQPELHSRAGQTGRRETQREPSDMRDITRPDRWREEEEEEGNPERREPYPERRRSNKKEEIREELQGQSAACSQQELSFCGDEEMVQCRKIQLRDLNCLGRRDRGLANNNFLRRGACRYGYLLLGQKKDDGKYLLGVPGVYERQECLMANMSGFPYFKEACRYGRNPGRFGYWYRFIDTPDLQRFDGKPYFS